MRYLIFILCLFAALEGRGQIITTVAGGGTVVGGEGVPATSVRLANPCGGVFDKYGNYYFTECLGGHRVRKIDGSGIITTIAGNGVAGFSGDGGPATSASLRGPTCVVLDSVGNIYISDASNFRIRKIDGTSGLIKTIAGNGIGGYSGDGGPASSASISNAPSICLDKDGNLFIADFGNARVRKVNSSGTISTFAGNGAISGYSGDGSRADTANIGGIVGVFVDRLNEVYLSANSNMRILKVNTSGIISTLAGTGIGYSYNGDEIQATTANIDAGRITVDEYGHIFISEHLNYRVRIVNDHKIISTIAGNGTSGFSGDGGIATLAQLSYPSGIALDSCGDLYIAEANNNRIRKVTFPKCHYLDVKELPTNQQSISIHPNPTTNLLTIELQTTMHYTLLSLLGTTLQQGQLHAGSNTISLAGLPAGIYLLHLDDNNQRTVHKILKQ